MPIIMQQHGDSRGNPLPHDGEYLQHMDFEAYAGRGAITLTPDPAKAMHFASTGEAFEFWKRSPKCRPIRPDGQPNRPLTGANWQFSNWEPPQEE